MASNVLLFILIATDLVMIALNQQLIDFANFRYNFVNKLVVSDELKRHESLHN